MPQPSPRRIVIHAGFHKTGTSTVQQVLKHAHQAALPHLCVVLKSDIPELCAAARDYAARPTPAGLKVFTGHAARCFGILDDDPRPILISAEDLCGHIPGRNGRVGYPHARTLLAKLIDTLPAHTDPHVFLSTRARTPWMRSCYAHHLRHAPMRMSWEDYEASQKDAPDLLDITDDIRSGLGAAAVSAMAIETSAPLAQGLLTPILDLLDLPPSLREPLTPTRSYNTAMPPDILAQFLILNRSDDTADSRNTAKQALIAASRRAKT
jgi:hypothetical protein